MENIYAIIYGVVEGITEFLPISSTGHLMLVTQLLGNDSSFIKSFEIIIQLGAILAIIALYPKRLLADKQTILRVSAAFIPTALLGLLFYKIIKTYLLASVPLVLVTLFLGGVIIIWFEKFWLNKKEVKREKTVNDLPIAHAAYLGLIQCIAFIPGVSRSAATIFGGMFFGLSRKEAVEFSFFLAVPTMAAATGLDLIKNYQTFSVDDVSFLVIGFVTSFVVALLAVKWLTRFVASNDFTYFGIYRMGIAILGYFLFFY
ncbi:MAG: Undecaprenyl-diphosphatase [Parcubacteria group bacterium GW2011_GWA2_47_7]|nr:MAG: Undecaprenyl-diphosphatase [Parcubacteria group bacterium GW2011_GWA2_47_7]